VRTGLTPLAGQSHGIKMLQVVWGIPDVL
jgi:hypothetical protein